MSIGKKNAPLVVTLLTALFGTSGLTATVTSGCVQHRGSSGHERESIKRPASINSGPPVAAPTKLIQPSLEVATNSVLIAAAKQNSSLQNHLRWNFGGKEQRGWHLYVPLISRLIETESRPDTNEFAAALARWQHSVGLAPSGILDHNTLLAMVATWQSRRTGTRRSPLPDQLVTAPVADFFDPERPPELRQIERQAYAAYKRMVAAAVADRSLGLAIAPDGELAPSEKLLKIISSYRSKEYQERLRKQTPQAGRAGLAVNSPHFTGRALDIYVGGDPVETKDANRAVQVRTRVYKWLVRNGGQFGFRPYFYEPWHWEYIPHTEENDLDALSKRPL